MPLGGNESSTGGKRRCILIETWKCPDANPGSEIPVLGIANLRGSMSTFVKLTGFSMRSSLRPIAVLWLILGAGHALFGQTATGNIVGRVMDSTEAVIAGVE